jgi:hypothetical protein
MEVTIDKTDLFLLQVVELVQHQYRELNLSEFNLRLCRISNFSDIFNTFKFKFSDPKSKN